MYLREIVSVSKHWGKLIGIKARMLGCLELLGYHWINCSLLVLGKV